MVSSLQRGLLESGLSALLSSIPSSEFVFLASTVRAGFHHERTKIHEDRLARCPSVFVIPRVIVKRVV
jgi:hypothetical protein